MFGAPAEGCIWKEIGRSMLKSTISGSEFATTTGQANIAAIQTMELLAANAPAAKDLCNHHRCRVH